MHECGVQAQTYQHVYNECPSTRRNYTAVDSRGGNGRRREIDSDQDFALFSKMISLWYGPVTIGRSFQMHLSLACLSRVFVITL